MLTRIGYHSLTACSDGPMQRPGTRGRFTVMACFCFEEEISSLFPYVKAVAERARMFEKPPMVRFVYKQVYCAAYPERCVVSPLDSRDQARTFAEDLTGFLGDILARQDEITPDYTFTRFKSVTVPQILKLLPGSNCGECGLKTCVAFAAMVARQIALPEACPHMARPVSQTFAVLDAQGRPVSQVVLPVDSRQPPPAPAAPKHKAAPQPAVRLPEPGRAPGAPGRPPNPNSLMPDPLTPREIQVLALMGEGRTNPEISERLGITGHTVKSHVVHIFNKLGVNHRTQAVVWAVRNGMI